MKLLLTSSGLLNNSLIDAVVKMAGRPTRELVVAFIPTASMVVKEDKGWFVEEMALTHKLGWKEFLIVDVTPGTPKDTALEQLGRADVIYGCGGNQYYLADCVNKSGIASGISKLFETKVYIGSSAGSQIFTKHLNREDAVVFDELDDFKRGTSGSPFNWFDWYIKPHYLSTSMSERTVWWAEDRAKKVDYPVYFLDDQSAVMVDGDRIEVISEGKWKLYE